MAANETPPFWFEPAGLKAWLMAPLSLLYSRAAALAMHARPSGGVDVPVLCIGNFVAGGGGKTPTALALAETARRRGFTPGFLSRGYGANITTPVIVEPNVGNTVGPDPKIIIPKIGVEAPVVYDEPRVDENSYQAALERGVVRLGNTANPGTNGNVVIGGHSSNNVFNPGNYKYVFVNLKQLQVNDIFYLHYEGVRYTYKVTVANKIIAPNETSVLNQTTTPTVTLFTCDPPGTNINRLIVQAVQIDPDPNDATVNENKATNTSKTNPLPSVAPSLWDRLFGN